MPALPQLARLSLSPLPAQASPAAGPPERVSSRKRRKNRRFVDADEEEEEEAGEEEAGGEAGAEAEAVATPPAPPPAPSRGVRVALPEPSDTFSVSAPFTLRSIGVTVWELGTIQRASFAPRFWSSRGCLFHHAYPVGYRAAKSHFGRAYSMHILAGECGPVFRVVDDASGEVFDGLSPTQPWTAVCTSKRLGTRISGPLFFGFSDPLTQRALCSLYTPAELAAARAGGVVASAAPSTEERAASEFRTLDGLGEKTSLALAHTRALLPGGARLEGLSALRALVQADAGASLQRFLTQSDEVSEATRRWPIWASVFVPKIVAQLLAEAGGACTTPAQAGEAGVIADPPGSGSRATGRATGRKARLAE